MELKGHNFRYSLHYNYDIVRNCSDNHCDDEGICRCSIIENPYIILVNVHDMVEDLISNFYDNSASSKRNSKLNSILGGITKEIDIYTIDRILRINKVFLPEVWEIQITDGYYGQEIDDIILENSLAEKIQKEIEEAFLITDLNKRIEYLLGLEYGFLLPELKDCKYEIGLINRDSIVFGSVSQHNRVSSENLDWYSDKNFSSIRGIVLCKGNEFRLIDGYHRCFASENKEVEVLIASKD